MHRLLRVLPILLGHLRVHRVADCWPWWHIWNRSWAHLVCHGWRILLPTRVGTGWVAMGLRWQEGTAHHRIATIRLVLWALAWHLLWLARHHVHPRAHPIASNSLWICSQATRTRFPGRPVLVPAALQLRALLVMIIARMILLVHWLHGMMVTRPRVPRMS